MEQPPVQTHVHYAQQPEPGPKNGLGTAALVLGIIGAACSWVPILGFLTVVSSLVGVGVGIGGVVRTFNKSADNTVIAWVGLSLSLFGVIAPWVFWAAIFAAGAAGSSA